jgi:tRNA-specific 2-thiouridylase
MTGKKVIVGLSGGVDSSVAAALLLKQGHEVEGAYLECYNEPGCRTDQDKADALKVAIKLGIKFQVLDFRKEYKEKVIGYFYKEYAAGRTPNPDVMCNREIKFGIFYDWAIAHGYDFVATGHYCRIRDGRLQRARDESKDQSYFLWQIPEDHLVHILFPLGNMLKSEVRVKAKELGLSTANKPDSMGICFIGEVDVAKLLRDRLGEKPGSVSFKGEVIGTHKGLWFFTIGQRGGWEMDPKKQSSEMPQLYVIAKDIEKNELIVGKREETMRTEFRVDLSTPPRLAARQVEMTKKLWVRIRNLGELHEVTKIEGARVEVKEPIFGLAEGQSAVFYDKNGVLVCGGIIV